MVIWYEELEKEVRTGNPYPIWFDLTDVKVRSSFLVRARKWRQKTARNNAEVKK